MNILITGATGNVGRAVLKHFQPMEGQRLYIATRKRHNLQPGELYFDVEDAGGTAPSLQQTDVLFLIRPPQISRVKKYFHPMLQQAKAAGVQHVLFLSVQGAEYTSYIPHARIEKYIKKSGFTYTFIRPSYFMQNLATVLAKDIRQRNAIYLPAGKAPFLWIDADDIGRAIAEILKEPGKHHNTAYTLTGNEYHTFADVAKLMCIQLHRPVWFVSANLVHFFIKKLRKGTSLPFIFVMALLHYLPRFQKRPPITEDYKRLTGRQPKGLEQFIEENRDVWV